MTIPVCLIEEHHEAYYCWHYFKEQGWIEKENNYLLHIDHHDDLASPAYLWDFSKMPQNYEEAREFVYQALGIGDFIFPAVYEKLFSVVHLMLKVTPEEYENIERVIKAKGTELLVKKYIPFIHEKYRKDPKSPYAFFTMRSGGLNPIKIEQPLVLDVDLDYFCWDDSCATGTKSTIEITKEAYEDFQTNRYHPFRLMAKRIMQAEIRDGKYYLNCVSGKERDIIPDKEKMIGRIERVINWLSENQICPAAIDICRSAHSGYLPSEEAKFVEEEFLHRLGKLYDLKFYNLL
ncbi:MAG: UPF0489 family protein [Eubacteriales bacterium]|nr:UPF0489 family protein [Eubacteriales bacterium]